MSLKSFLKKVGKGVGKVTSVASPLLMATGVGAPLALALGAAGGYASGHNTGEVLKGLVKNAALGTAGKAAIGGLKGLQTVMKGGGKVSPVAGNLNPDDLSKVIGNSSMPGGAAPGLGSSSGGGGGGWLDSLTGALGFKNAQGGTDWAKILGTAGKVGLGAAGAVSAAKQQGKADELRDKALRLVESEYAEAAPLRKLGMAGLTDPRVRDLSSIFQTPQAQYRRLAV
jgi:hypothetical protein